MRLKTSVANISAVAAAVVCVSILVSQEAMAQGNFIVDSFFDITYTVEIDPAGGIGVTAVGILRSGERAKVPTDVLRVIRAGEITKIYVNHPNEEAITEIEVYLFGEVPGRITGLRITEPKKRTHRGHVTVLK